MKTRGRPSLHYFTDPSGFAAYIVLVVCALCIFSTSMPAQEPVKASAQMKDDEKILSWKGERVILLNPMPHEPNYRELYYYRDGRRGDQLPKEGFAYKKGVVTEARITGTRPYGPLKTYMLVVTLDDSGEKIYVDDSIYGEFGFLAEMEAAKAVIGQTMWARGGKELYDSAEHRLRLAPKSILAKNTEMLTLFGLDWGHDGLMLCFKTATNQEGCMESPIRFEKRFIPSWPDAHTVDAQEFPKVAAEYFYFKDPRKIYPTWSRAIWELIEKGEIAIGMTEKMAEVACGHELSREGSILVTQDIVSPIFSCGSKRYLFAGGKVARYVELRPY